MVGRRNQEEFDLRSKFGGTKSGVFEGAYQTNFFQDAELHAAPGKGICMIDI
jgi:hypothetical protein